MRAGRGTLWLFVLAVMLPAAAVAQSATSSDSVKRIRVGKADVVRRDSSTGYAYTRPRLLHAVTDVPAALGASARSAFRPSNIPAMMAVAASTGLLIAADEQVLAETRRLGNRVGLPQNHPSANGVHWASDYPLALAIGAVVGKTVATRGRTVVKMPAGPSGDGVKAGERSRLSLFDVKPIVAPGVLGVRATW
jgi:hypothetical protein